MVDPIPANEIPKNIGRNDPCPCESGKKYKKCCYRTHQLQKESEKSTGDVDDLVSGDTTPWQFFKTLGQVRENNLLKLAYDFIHDESPLRKKYKTSEAFIKGFAEGNAFMFARLDFELVRLRHDGPDLILLLARGLNDPKYTTVNFEILSLRDNTLDASGETREAEVGSRVWDVSYVEKSKSEFDAENPRFSDVGIAWTWEQ